MTYAKCMFSVGTHILPQPMPAFNNQCIAPMNCFIVKFLSLTVVHLGRFKYVLWLEAEVQDKLKELFEMDMQICRKFLRTHIRGKVYYSLEYKRTKKRNSYTVCYSSDDVEKFGFIRYFISLSGSTVADGTTPSPPESARSDPGTTPAPPEEPDATLQEETPHY